MVEAIEQPRWYSKSVKTRARLRLLRPPSGPAHLGCELANETGIASEAQHILHVVGLAPRHQVVAAEAKVSADDDCRRRPTDADLGDDAGNLGNAAVSGVPAR